MTWPFGSLQMFKYQVVVADVPAEFNFRAPSGINDKAAAGQYQTMTDAEIAALPVGNLASRDSLLLYWTTGWAVASCRAQDIVRAWGAEPVSEIVWIKVTKNGKPRMGTGYRVRSFHEPILLAKWGNPQHIAFPSSFTGVARQHSMKPDEFYKIVVERTLGAWRCDLFSAGIQRPGFEGWGEDHRNIGGESDGTRRLRFTQQSQRTAMGKGDREDGRQASWLPKD